MHYQTLKKWIVGGLLFLLLVCAAVAFITIGKTAEAAAEINDAHNTEQNCEYELSNISNLSVETSSESDGKAVFKELSNKGLLSEGDDGLSQIHYIGNANYFLANPYHHENISKSKTNDDDTSVDHILGTCTTVAHQILLGYHNYYSDRRLIPQYGSDGTQYLSDNYGVLTEHPTIKSDAGAGLGRNSIGTNDAVFYKIFNLAGGADSLVSQTPFKVIPAAHQFLLDCANGREQNWTIEGTLIYHRDTVQAELDAGRPVIVGFDPFGKHSAHVVVAYGYAMYEGEFCYITDYGWEDEDVQMLVPESWLGYQITMQVNHTHSFVSLGEIYNDIYLAKKCTVCGCTTLEKHYVATLFAGGSGTESDPFLIANETQFRNIAYAHRPVYVTYQGYEEQINYCFKLLNDIKLQGDWTPFQYDFTGKLDGNDRSITYNMTISQDELSDDYFGLFRFASENSRFCDLKLSDCTIRSEKGGMTPPPDGATIGALTGSLYKCHELTNVQIINPTIEIDIEGSTVGAIAGSIDYTPIDGCIVSGGSITNHSGYTGGFAGLGFMNTITGGMISTTIYYSDGDTIGPVIGGSSEKYGVDVQNEKLEKMGGCLAEGTLITLADGSKVPVEQLTGEEMFLVWNMYTGEFDVAPILFIDSEPSKTYRVIDLSFSDGTNVKVVYEHGFWDYDLNKYVYLDENAAEYLGHWFEKTATDENGVSVHERVQLVGVEIKEEQTALYSPITYGHFCYFVNDMLSMPGGIDGMFNIFEVEPETMRYDATAMQADIEKYGLFLYEDFSRIVPVSEEVFKAFQGQYLKVAIGKGYITEERLAMLARRYANLLAEI